MCPSYAPGRRQGGNVCYPCGSIPWEGVSFWFDCSQDHYAFGLDWTFKNRFVSSSSMVSKCNTKQSMVEIAILQLASCWLTNPHWLPCDGGWCATVPWWMLMHTRWDCEGSHWVLQGSINPRTQWPGSHWILGYSDWGSLNPGCYWILRHQY